MRLHINSYKGPERFFQTLLGAQFKILFARAFKTLFFIPLLFLTPHSYGQAGKLLKIFPSCSPEQQGLSSLVLDSLLRFIKNTNQNIHHLTIIRNDQTVLDADIYPYSSQYLHDLASVTKSFTSMLIGIAIDKGFIKDENEPVLHFFPEITNHNALLDSFTIKDLVTMRSGFDCGVEDGEKALNNMRKTGNWVKFIFDLPVISRPGDTFSYCSCNFYLLAEIIYRTSRLIPHDFAKKYLFTPLGISNTKWLTNYKGMNNGWGDLFLYPADMAKIGKLILDKGKWQGKQIISKQWIKKSLQTLSKLPDDKGYGYGWWTNDKVGYYEAAGRGRQTISVIPSKNMVVTMLGGEFDAGTIGKYIFESVKSDKPLPNNFNDYNRLKTSLREVASAPVFKSVKINNNLIQILNNKTIAVEKNIAEIDSLQFDFVSKEKGTVTFYKNNSARKYPFALSTNNYALGFDPELQLPVALQANFKNENEFVLHFNQLCRINNFYFHFVINGNNIITTMEETSNFIKTNIESSFR
jgi:CubicO group peptidase (beta-lactamase class C family)